MNETSGTSAPIEISRPPLPQRLFGAFVLALMAPVALGMAITAFILMRQNLTVGLVLAAVAAGIAFLVDYVGRDTYAKWRLRAAFGPQSVALRLPANRSLIHRPPAFDGVIAYRDIAAIETRLEAYRSAGLAAIQRAYALRLRDGTLIILGEDRALGTGLAQYGGEQMAAKLAARAGIAFTDLGMVEGRGGVLMVGGATPDVWSAASLGQNQQERLWRRVALTGAAPMTIFLLALLMAAMFGS